jgi:hypothetical protein
MTEDYGTPISEDEPKNNTRRNVIIVVVVLVVLCCCCVAGGYGVVWLWNNGDRLLQDLDLSLQIPLVVTHLL